MVKTPTRESQVCIAEEDNSSLVDFLRDGVQFGSAVTNDIREAAKCIHRCVEEECSVADLENMDVVNLSAEAKAFDQGSEVDYEWNYSAQSSRTFEL